MIITTHDPCMLNVEPRLKRRVRPVSWGAAAGCLLLLLNSPADADLTPARLDSLSAYVEGLAAFGFAGQILVAEGDSILVSRAAGAADSTGRPIGPHTRFALGSITKSLTGALAVRFAARGRLDLDAPIATLLDDVPADKRGITVRHLLTHRSGLPADATIDEDDAREAVVRKTLAESLWVEPGSRFAYSNAGYQLAAAILERTSGRTFAELAADEIFGPCGMTESSTGATAARNSADVAAGRNEWTFLGSPRTWRQRWAGTGAGDLVSTGRDLLRWARALQGAGPLEAGELDSLLARRASLGERLFYGFGVYMIPSVDGPDLVSVGGDIPGFHAAAWVERQPPWRATIVVMSGERFGRSLAVTAIQRPLWRLLAGQPVRMPPVAGSWPRDRLESLTGDWTIAGGGRLALDSTADGLRLGLAGAAGVDVVLGPDSADVRAARDARAAAVFEAAAKSEASLADALHPVEYGLWAGALRDGIEGAVARLGKFRAVEGDGTIPLPWLDTGTRTYVRLRFARGTLDASLAWLDGALLDVAFGEGRPQPVLLPVAPLAEGGLAAWDLLDGTVVRLEPFRDPRGPGLRVSGPKTRAIARRAHR